MNNLVSTQNINNVAPKEVVGYIRVSTNRQVDGVSLDNQKDAIKKYAGDHNMKIVKWYCDGGFSAKTAKRPDLQKLLCDIESKKLPNVRHVVVYNVSRISRNVESYAAEIGTRLAHCGVTLRSTQEPVDETPIGKLMLSISLAIHQFDNDNKAVIVRDDMRCAGMAGWWQSCPPVGMVIGRYDTGEKRSNGKKKTHAILLPDEENHMADKVRTVLTRFSRGDMTVAELTRYAEKVGVRTKRGNPLSETGVKAMLKQAAYAGMMRSKKITNGELINANWDGIISPEIYHDNLDRLENSKRKRSGRAVYLRDHPEYPLKGVLFCSYCGAPLRGSAPTGGSGKKSPRYHCSECKGSGSIGVDEAHAAFVELLKNIAPTKNTRELFRTIAKRTLKGTLGETNKAIKKCRKELSENDEAYEEALLKAAKGNFSDERLEKLETIINTKRSELNAEIEKLERQRTISEKSIDRLIGFMGEPARLWGKADLPTRQLLQQLVFPNGVKCSPKEKIFGTDEISPLYSVISNKKESSNAKNSSMVHPARFERVTFSSGN